MNQAPNHFLVQEKSTAPPPASKPSQHLPSQAQQAKQPPKGFLKDRQLKPLKQSALSALPATSTTTTNHFVINNLNFIEAPQHPQ